jgi:two-component system, sensor histidine kinase
MHILYLEDEPNDAALVERYVRTTPHEITIVQNTVDAEKALDNNPALILVDVLLGNTRAGFEFMRVVRKRGYTQPIVAITALTLPQDLEQCIAAGCTEIIPKPYTISVLDKVFNKYVPLS